MANTSSISDQSQTNFNVITSIVNLSRHIIDEGLDSQQIMEVWICITK